MKGGIFSVSETFMKIISTGYVAIVLLGIFFAINQYHIVYMENRLDRETLNVGNTVLSSCIAEERNGYVVKGLLSSEKLAAQTKDKNIDCLNFYKGVYIEVFDSQNALLYGVGNGTVCSNYPMGSSDACKGKTTTTNTVFPASLNTANGIIHVIVNVTIGA
jgi:hypothetical protein